MRISIRNRADRQVAVLFDAGSLETSSTPGTRGASGFNALRTSNGRKRGGDTHARSRLIRIVIACCLVVWSATADDMSKHNTQHTSSGRTPETKKLWHKADRLWHEKNVHEWTKVLERIAKLDPADIEAWKLLGWGYNYWIAISAKGQKQRDRSIAKGMQILRKGAKANPKSAVLQFELGWALFDRIGDVQAAVPHFQSAIALDRASKNHLSHDCQHMPMHCYERVTDMDKALTLWRRHQKESPTCATARQWVRTIEQHYLKPWRLLQQGKYKDASRSLQPYLQKEPDNVVSIYLQVEICTRSGDVRRANNLLKGIKEAPATFKL